MALSSGTSALYYIITICSAGDKVLSVNNLYSGAHTMFDNVLPQFGIKVDLVDPLKMASFKRAINEKTRALCVETIGNPVLDVVDFEVVAKVAREHHLPLIVCSTFTTPYLIRPFDYGADIICHSLTKWPGRHGLAIGGIAVDSGTFDWSDDTFAIFNRMVWHWALANCVLLSPRRRSSLISK